MIKKESYEQYCASNQNGIEWVNPSSFKSQNIQTPWDYYYKLTHPSKNTEATSIGSMFHEYFLENELFRKSYYFLKMSDFPQFCQKTDAGFPNLKNKDNKNIITNFQNKYPNRKIIAPDDSFTLNNLIAAFRRIRDLGELLDLNNGLCEISLYCFAKFDKNGDFEYFRDLPMDDYLKLSETEKIMYLPIKTRPDYMHNWRSYIIDLKTTTSIYPDNFKKEILQYGYHVQAALALDVATCITGIEYDTFIFPTAENKPPFNSIKYMAKDRMIDEGRVTYKAKLKMIHDARLKNDYPGLEIFSDVVYYDENGTLIENKQIINIDLPEWYYYNKLK